MGALANMLRDSMLIITNGGFEMVSISATSLGYSPKKKKEMQMRRHHVKFIRYFHLPGDARPGSTC